MVRRFLRVSLVFLIFSCSDENEVRKTSYFGLKTGSYWIYRTKIIFPDESFQIFDHLDSVWIEGTTTIDGKEYYVRQSSLNGEQYLRDSANCMLLRILSYKEIIYSSQFKDTLYRDPPIVRIMTVTMST